MSKSGYQGKSDSMRSGAERLCRNETRELKRHSHEHHHHKAMGGSMNARAMGGSMGASNAYKSGGKVKMKHGRICKDMGGIIAPTQNQNPFQLKSLVNPQQQAINQSTQPTTVVPNPAVNPLNQTAVMKKGGKVKTKHGRYCKEDGGSIDQASRPFDVNSAQAEQAKKRGGKIAQKYAQGGAARQRLGMGTKTGKQIVPKSPLSKDGRPLTNKRYKDGIY